MLLLSNPAGQKTHPKDGGPPIRSCCCEPSYHQCGVDCIGPVLVKEGRKRLKGGIVFFTCLTVRCIHLEVVETAETDAFINSMRRFTNRRGCPSVMYSDQGSNFCGASIELKEFVSNLDQAAINRFATELEIKGQFNPPKSPHMGGIWERMVRSVKEVMHGILKDHTLTDPQPRIIHLPILSSTLCSSKWRTYTTFPHTG